MAPKQRESCFLLVIKEALLPVIFVVAVSAVFTMCAFMRVVQCVTAVAEFGLFEVLQ
jgi:hypothetical protein